MDPILGRIMGVCFAIGGSAILLQKQADIGSDDNVVLVKGCFKNVVGAIFLILGSAYLIYGIISM